MSADRRRWRVLAHDPLLWSATLLALLVLGMNELRPIFAAVFPELDRPVFTQDSFLGQIDQRRPYFRDRRYDRGGFAGRGCELIEDGETVGGSSIIIPAAAEYPALLTHTSILPCVSATRRASA